jgi:hypothetical protein
MKTTEITREFICERCQGNSFECKPWVLMLKRDNGSSAKILIDAHANIFQFERDGWHVMCGYPMQGGYPIFFNHKKKTKKHSTRK